MNRRFFLLLLAARKRDLTDINSATIEELTMLPGIAQAKAQAIIKNRPYSNKAQLLTRKILSAGEYRRVRDLIIASRGA